MTFGEGSDVDTAIVVQAVGIGQGEGSRLSLPSRVFQSPASSAHGSGAIVCVPPPSSTKKKRKGWEDNEGVGPVESEGMGRRVRWIGEHHSAIEAINQNRQWVEAASAVISVPFYSDCPLSKLSGQACNYATQSRRLCPTNFYTQATHTISQQTHDSTP